MKSLAFLLVLVSGTAFAQVSVENPWSRATPPGAKIAVGYMTIRNAGAAPDRLVSASSPAAEKVETHVTVKDGDVFKMREVKGYDVPAKGSFELKPGGAHFMLVNIKAPLKEGEKIPLVLKFARAGEVRTELQVQALGGSAPMQPMHMGH